MAETVTLWPIERRILSYLQQRGPSWRTNIVLDLAPEGSVMACPKAGSAAGAARVMGAWARRLLKAGLVREVRNDEGAYRCHEITGLGQEAIRSGTFVAVRLRRPA